MAVAIIPARGGSRRIPRKNIRDFLGKPMLAYPINAARSSGVIEQVYVSTEDAEIARVAKKFGAQVHERSKEMAENGVGTQEVVRNAILELWPSEPRPEYVVCIYPCAPTLLPSDLRTAYEALKERDTRQYVQVEGMFYFGRTKAFVDDLTLEAPHTAEMEDSYRWIDINVEADWLEAKSIYKRMRTRQGAKV
jgi:pseudaminic acid cytidylyltransferase